MIADALTILNNSFKESIIKFSDQESLAALYKIYNEAKPYFTNFSVAHADEFINLFEYVCANYAPAGWLAAVDGMEKNVLTGWAANTATDHPDFISINVNTRCAYESFLADLPRRDASGFTNGKVFTGYEVYIDPGFMTLPVNIISLLNPDNNKIFAFSLYSKF